MVKRLVFILGLIILLDFNLKGRDYMNSKSWLSLIQLLASIAPALFEIFGKKKESVNDEKVNSSPTER